MLDDNKLFFKILDKTINFLSYKSRSTKEVSDRIDVYLRKVKNLSQSDAATLKDRVLEEFSNLKLLDDLVFAKAYIKEKNNSPKPASKRAISNFLYKKGIPKDIMAEALEDINPESELLSVNKIADKKLRSLGKYDLKEAKRRLATYLIGKGYSPSIVFAVVDTKFKVK